jgi:hypothetical protein
MIRSKAFLGGALLALLTLAGCGTTGSDIFGGGGYPSSNGTYSNDLRGTVDSVDLRNGSIVLTNTNGYNSMLSGSGSGGDSVRVYFDDRTTVNYQGRSYRPEDLQRGDQVDVRVTQSGNRLVADSMNVTYNANASNYPNGSSPNGNYPNGSYPNGNYPNSNGTYGDSNLYTVRGTVRAVDAYRGEITLDQVGATQFNRNNSGNGTMVVRYDRNARVDVQGNLSPVANLERGDVVEMQVENDGSNSYVARNITLVRDIRR